MRLEIFLVGSDGRRIPVWSDMNYRPQNKGGASVLLDEAVSFALKTVVLNYFDGGFGIEVSSVSASAGVLKKRIKCLGKRIGSEAQGANNIPPTENLSSELEFEVELRLDADSLKVMALSGIRLNNISISNLRSLKSLRISFVPDSKLFLVAGLNGSGKTSILEAVAHAFLHDSAREGIRPLVGENYNIAIHFVDAKGDAYVVEKTYKSHTLKDASGKVIADTSYELRRMFADVGMAFLSSWRVPINIRMSGVFSRMRKQNEAIANLRNACIAEYVNSVLKPQEATRRIFHTLNAVWRRFYPENSSEFFIGEDPSILTKGNTGELTFDLQLMRSGEHGGIPLEELSSGELEVLTFISALLVRPRPADIILIDEPELHLNRVWHRTVLDAIVEISPESQFIVATHAPEIWESVYSWNRMFISSEGGLR